MSVFTVTARPYHLFIGKVLLVLLLVMLGLLWLLFRSNGFMLMIPISVIMAAIWLPVFLDHAGVTYAVEPRGIVLRKKNKDYKCFDAARIKSVNHRGNTVVIRPVGIVGQPIFLHPASDAAAMVLAIQESLLK